MMYRWCQGVARLVEFTAVMKISEYTGSRSNTRGAVGIVTFPGQKNKKKNGGRRRAKGASRVAVVRYVAPSKKRSNPNRTYRLATRGQRARGPASTNYDIAVARSNAIAPMRFNGMGASSANRIVVTMTEQLTDITTVTTTGAVALTVVIAPTTLSSRNATFNHLYELCHLQKVIFRYVPNSSTAVPGNVATVVDYNATEGAAPNTLALCSMREGVQRHHAWESFSHLVKWKDAADLTAMVDSSKSTSHRPDGQVYTFCLVVGGGPTSGATLLGWLECTATYIYTGLKAYEAP